MPLNIEHDAGESLADDLLRGAGAIGAFIGLGLRETFYGLQEGHIPGRKEGRTWVSSKTVLRKHYTEFQASLVARTKGKGVDHCADNGDAQGIAYRGCNSLTTSPSPSPSPSPSRSSTTMRLADIRIGERHRKDMGDIDGLAASMAELGLLQEIGVRPDGLLIWGERRFLAAKLLGWTEIPVNVVDLDSVVRGEFAENACRKDFTPSELVAIGKEVERTERERAKHRKAHEGRPGKLPERQTGDARDKVAARLGVSGRHYEKAKAVVAAAEAEPQKYGGLLADMDRTGRVDGPYQRLQNAKQAERIRVEPPPLPGHDPLRGKKVSAHGACDPEAPKMSKPTETQSRKARSQKKDIGYFEEHSMLVNKSHPALKHGGYSTTTILPTESVAEFEKLHRDVISELVPNGALADDIVATITRMVWRKRNLPTFQTAEVARFNYEVVMSREFSRMLPEQTLPPELQGRAKAYADAKKLSRRCSPPMGIETG